MITCTVIYDCTFTRPVLDGASDGDLGL